MGQGLALIAHLCARLMAFLHPSFLWALTALAIPVFIHLFQLRRFKRIEFPDVRFLQEVAQRTRSRKKVRHWLVLLARMLALACLVLAFAQPYVKRAEGTVAPGQRAVSLYLDDSWSMDGQNGKGRLMDQDRADAQEAVMAYRPTDRFQVITNRFEGRQQLLLGRDEALAAAGQVDVGPWARPLSQVMQRQHEALFDSDAPVKQAFLFTDLQHVTTDVEHWTNDSAVRTVIVPIQAATTDNLSVDSAWFGTPVRRAGQVEMLHVRIRNRGKQELHNVPLRLAIDGRQRAMATFGIAAGATVDTSLTFTNDATGPHEGVVSIEDRPITFDNDLHIAWRTAAKLHVLLVSGDDPAGDRDVAAVFGEDSTHLFTSQTWRQLDLSALAAQDLVVLNALPEIPSGLASALKDQVLSGGSLAIFPADRPDAASYQAALALFGARFGARDTSSAKVERIDLRSPFFRDVFSTMPENVDLPLVRDHFTLMPAPAAETLLRLQSGLPFLSATPSGKGQVYLCAAPLDSTGGNFSRHALFVTSLLRMAELARPMGQLYHIIGAETAIPVEGAALEAEAAPHLKGPAGIDLIPEVRRTVAGTSLILHDEDLKPGAYALTVHDDTLALLALDLPRSEGDLAAFTADELSEALARQGLSTITVLKTAGMELAASLKELDQGIKLWKWFILGSLLFLILEVLLIRTIR